MSITKTKRKTRNESTIASGFIFLLLIVLQATMSFSLFGQESRAVLSGLVVDATGSGVPGVQVIAVRTETNVRASVTTDASGVYVLPFLAPGTYRVTAESTGFRTYTNDRVEMRVGDNMALNITLEVVGVQTTVDVVESTPLLETASATTGTVVEHRSITDLPLSDGNPFTLAHLAAGVVFTREAMDSLRPFDNNGTSGFRVSGAPGGNSFSLDGAPNGAPARVSYVPPAGAVEEFKIETLAYDAQQGASGGASVNVSIKSGTNSLHGSLYEFYRPDSLVANEFFGKRNGLKAQSFKYHRFGGTIGGPVFFPKFYDGRNKTFFFFAYENIMNDRPSVEMSTVPGMDERRGDFSRLLGQGIQIYNPFTGQAVGSRIQREPVANNLIPTSMIDPIAINYLSYYPEPNLAGTSQGQNNYLSDNATESRFNSQLLRMDHHFSEKHRTSFRWNRNMIDEGGSPGWTGMVNGINPSMSQFGRQNKGASLDHLYTISGGDILNLRGGVTRFSEIQAPVAPGFNIGSLGFGSSTLALFQKAAYLPKFSLSSYKALGGDAGKQETSTILFFQPTYTRVRGRHMMRLGYDFRSYRATGGPMQDPAVLPSFNNSYTRGPLDNSTGYFGQDLAALLYGLPSSGQLNWQASRANQEIFQGWFFQDDFKVSQNLTLNLGLRYEYESAPTERYNRNVRGFDFVSASPIEDAARAAYARNPDPNGLTPDQFRVKGGYLFADDSNRNFWQASRNNFQPRVGVAWKVSENTVIRGGFGVYMVPFFISGVRQNGFSQVTPVVSTLNGGLDFVASTQNPFPSGILRPLGASGGLSTYLGQEIEFVPLDRKNGSSQRWNLGIQHQLPGEWLVEVSYQGSRGSSLTYENNLNAIPRQYLTTSDVRDQGVIDYLDARVSNPFQGLIPGTDLNGSTARRYQLLRPYAQFQDVYSERNDGWSLYHGAQFKVQRRMRSGLLVNAAYSFSRMRDGIYLLNETDALPEDRTSRDDRPHRATIATIWELPFGRSRKWGSDWNRTVDSVLGGWQLGGMFLAQSGRPIVLDDRNLYFTGNIDDVRATYDKKNIGVSTFDVSPFYFHDAAVQTNGVDDRTKQRTDPRIQLGYNLRTLPSVLPNFRGPRIIGLDLSAIKEVQLTERAKLQVRGEVFNATNYVQFGDPQTQATNANFGLVSRTRNPTRQIQFALRLVF